MASNRSEVVGVQYLRGICAIAVVICHCGAMAAFPKYFGQLWLAGALQYGSLGVDLFFGISGFIISIVCLGNDTLKPSMTIPEFARKRFVRIIPLMWVAALSYAALQMVGRGGFHPKETLLALVPIFPGEPAPNAIWTLRHELMFYTIFALSLLGRRQIPWLLGLWFLSPVLFAFSGLHKDSSNWWIRWAYEWAHSCDVEFMAGFAVGVLWLKRTRSMSFKLPIDPLFVLLALFLAFWAIGVGLDLTVDKLQSTLISMFLVFGILLVAVHVECPDGWAKRVGDFLGAASYSIYLFHLHFLSAFLGIWSHFAKGTPIYIAELAIVTLTVIATCGVHIFVERPLIKFTNRLFKGSIPISISRRWAIGAAAVVVGLVVVTEIGLRVIGFGHPLLYRASAAGYEIVASQTSTRIGKTTHINAFGMRGSDTTPLPAVGVKRILSLGDSVANGGAQVNDQQTYPAMLQADLEKAGKKVEVINAAAGGWAVENELAWLKERGIFGAETILLEVNEKDLDQQFVDASILDTNPTFPSRYPATAIGEVLGRYLAPKLGLVKPAVDPGSTPTGVNPEAEAALVPAISQIHAIATAAKARLVIIYWDAHYGPVAPETTAVREKLFAFAQTNHIAVVRPQLNTRPDWNHLFRDNMHPNPAGNSIIAQQVANLLMADDSSRLSN